MAQTIQSLSQVRAFSANSSSHHTTIKGALRLLKTNKKRHMQLASQLSSLLNDQFYDKKGTSYRGDDY